MAGVLGFVSRLSRTTHGIKSVLQVPAALNVKQIVKLPLSLGLSSHPVPVRSFISLPLPITHVISNLNSPLTRNYHCLSIQNLPKPTILAPIQVGVSEQTRTVTKFSKNKGHKKSVKAVVRRFFRLDSGLWIRTHQGRHKHLWKKTNELKKMYRQHVVVTKAQCKMFEKMVQGYWKKKKYYIDDPYEPYHVRNNFPWAPPPKNKTTP